MKYVYHNRHFFLVHLVIIAAACIPISFRTELVMNKKNGSVESFSRGNKATLVIIKPFIRF
jgi:hypothetical protein